MVSSLPSFQPIAWVLASCVRECFACSLQFQVFIILVVASQIVKEMPSSRAGVGANVKKWFLRRSGVRILTAQAVFLHLLSSKTVQNLALMQLVMNPRKSDSNEHQES